jgi:hypothetical protein
MPRSKSTASNKGIDARGLNSSTLNQDPGADMKAVGSFLRGLASRVESDATLALQIQSALEESGLLERQGPAGGRKGKKAPGKNPAPPAPLATPPDPFRILREHGEKELRETLEKVDLDDLHAVVRTYRLDPARISSRWTRRERIIELIATQVVAQASVGQAFSRV